MAGLPFPDEGFDLVMLTEVIEHMEDPFRAVREFNRVLRPDGPLVLATPDYGHMEERLGYLFGGTLPEPLEARLLPPRAGLVWTTAQPASVGTSPPPISTVLWPYPLATASCVTSSMVPPSRW